MYRFFKEIMQRFLLSLHIEISYLYTSPFIKLTYFNILFFQKQKKKLIYYLLIIFKINDKF